MYDAHIRFDIIFDNAAFLACPLFFPECNFPTVFRFCSPDEKANDHASSSVSTVAENATISTDASNLHTLAPETANLTSVYHYSIPNVKLMYPEPFLSSASFMHFDL
jgi:hypothetical protein